LEELWLNENLIASLKSMEDSSGNSLRRLYFTTNKIRKIESLDHLKKLEVLWLDENEVDVNLSSLILLGPIRSLEFRMPS
jgi:Leucine-rich repeat (LRR) protein